MTDIEELVERFSREPPKADEFSILLRMAAGLFIGASGAAVIHAGYSAIAGSEDALSAIRPSTAKIAYSTALAAAAAALASQIAAPETRIGRSHFLVLAPVMIMAMIAMTELFLTPIDNWLPLMTAFGVSSCLSAILLTAPPIFAGLVWSFRRFAPTDLRAAGAAIGALSGATAGALYAAISGQASICFVFLWYSCAVAITTVAGALAGRFLLRW